jgi:hypothetical protein
MKIPLPVRIGAIALASAATFGIAVFEPSDRTEKLVASCEPTPTESPRKPKPKPSPTPTLTHLT